MLIPAQFGEKEEIYPWKKSNQNASKITNDYHECDHSFMDAPPVTLRGNFWSPIIDLGIFLDCGSILSAFYHLISKSLEVILWEEQRLW